MFQKLMLAFSTEFLVFHKLPQGPVLSFITQGVITIPDVELSLYYLGIFWCV